MAPWSKKFRVSGVGPGFFIRVRLAGLMGLQQAFHFWDAGFHAVSCDIGRVSGRVYGGFLRFQGSVG